MKKKKIGGQEFDRRFDTGEDMTQYLDLSSARNVGRELRRINVDLPTWIIVSLDFEARRLGVTRQSVIKVWIADRLRQEKLFSVSGEPQAGYAAAPAKAVTTSRRKKVMRRRTAGKG